MFTGNDDLITSTTTDASGNYSFSKLLPGDYYIKFELPSNYDAFAKVYASDDTKDSDANVITGKSPVKNLKTGETDTSIDAGIVRYLKPVKPTNSTDKPSTPSTPDDKNLADKPSTPNDKNLTNTPNTPVDKNLADTPDKINVSNLPDTATDNYNLLLLGILLALLSAAVIIYILKRKNKGDA